MTSFSMRRRALMTTAASAAALGTLPWREARAQASQNLLRRGNGSEPQTLDPHKATGVPEGNVLRDLFETLVTHDGKGGVTPGLAQRWDISPDGLTYTFHLRPNAKWSNGDAFTAEDVVWSWRRAVDPATASRFAWLYKPVDNADDITKGTKPPSALGVSAADPRTVVVKLNTVTSFFIELVSHYSMSPVHRASFERGGAQWTRPGNLVSSGAYMLTEWTPQSHLKMVRNPHYYNADQVRIPEVVFYPTEDRAAEVRRFRAGELDTTYELPVEEIPTLRTAMPNEFRNSVYFGTYYLTMNNQKAPYSDPRVRRALALVIDREAIINQILRAGEVPAYSWVPPGATDYAPQTLDFRDWPMQRRIDEAKRLVTAAGYGPSRPLEVEFLYNTNSIHQRIGVALASMWQQHLGARTEQRNMEFQVYLDATARKEYGLARAGWIGATHADASYFLEKFEGSAGEANTAAWKNANYDRYLGEANKTADPKRRRTLMEQAEAEMMKDIPIIPIYYYTRSRLVAGRVQGWETNVRDVNPTRYLSLRG
jgi:oligopeptide transport system substrate-binding protein